MNDLNSAGEESAKPRFPVRQRICWGLVTLAVLVFVGAAGIVFEAITGQVSGTVMQVRIDECAPRKLRMTGFRRPGSTLALRSASFPEDTIVVRPPDVISPLIASLRERFWEKTFGPSHAFAAFDKPGSVVHHVKTGDVIPLRFDENVTLMGWETGRTTDRWAITAYVEP